MVLTQCKRGKHEKLYYITCSIYFNSHVRLHLSAMKTKRTWRKHFDTMPAKDAVKALTDLISQLKSQEGYNRDDSFIRDLEWQRDEYKKRLKS